MSRHSLILFAAFAGLLAGVGCSRWLPWNWWEPPRPTAHERADLSAPPFSTSDRPRGYRRGRPDRVVGMRFDIVRADLPLDSVRHSLKIWNHVDELRIDSEVVSLLARNGIRVGAASQGAWPAISTIFNSCQAQVSESGQIARGGVPLSIELGTMSEPETVFCFDRAGRLAGRTIPAGDRVLKIEYVLHPQLSGCTDMNLLLQIRHKRSGMGWENVDGLIRQVPAYDYSSFDDLRVVLTLRPGEFLVIGPSEEAGNEYLVGNRFFSTTRAGDLCESVLCVTPRPFSLESNQRLLAPAGLR